jgi:hypothetical protein
MRSKPEILEKRADECRRRAATATDRQLKALFLNLTQQWNEIAHIGRMLDFSSKDAEAFVKKLSLRFDDGETPEDLDLNKWRFNPNRKSDASKHLYYVRPISH